MVKSVKIAGDLILYASLFASDWVSGRSLTSLQDNTGYIGKRDIILITCVCNDRHRITALVDYYRKLKVSHFLMIDNGSTDGFQEWAKDQSDISVWRTGSSHDTPAKRAHWVNELLRRYGTDHWCVVVDPDEFLVYPNMETRSLRSLTSFLDEERRRCMHALTIQTYEKPEDEQNVAAGAAHQHLYFDGEGYCQIPGPASRTIILGGPRMRLDFKDNPSASPSLNRIPLIKWKWHYHFDKGTHRARPFVLNRAHTPGHVSTTGALLRIDYTKAIPENETLDTTEKHYRKHSGFYTPGISVRYENPDQLNGLGIMSAGSWF